MKPTDSTGLADTMMRAFYQDAHWASLWKRITLENIIYDCARRLPWNLVKVTSTKRHRKVVDEATGNAVGYARWIIPDGHADTWANGIVLEDDLEKRQAYEQSFQNVTEDGTIRGIDHQMVDELSEAIEKAEAEALSTGDEFLGELSNVILDILLGLITSKHWIIWLHIRSTRDVASAPCCSLKAWHTRTETVLRRLLLPKPQVSSFTKTTASKWSNWCNRSARNMDGQSLTQPPSLFGSPNPFHEKRKKNRNVTYLFEFQWFEILNW